MDGDYHYEEEQQTNDLDRTLALSRLGFQIIRFDNQEVLNNIDEVLNKINKELLIFD